MSELPNGNTVQWRLTQLESTVKTLDAEKADVKDVNVLAKDLRGMKKAAVSLAFGLPITGVTFLLGVLALMHN